MNRLSKEKSPYLLQHQNNPVDWYAWGEEAFQAARAQNKPIFLSIGYSTCYWCHMMEKDSFELQEVAEVLNKNFINIKVDREEHPDVDQIYMDAVVSLTGQGGWPMSVFLSPDLKPFFGGTFFWRAQFIPLLNNIASVWQNSPEKIIQSGNDIQKHLSERIQPATGSLDATIFTSALQQFAQSFDTTHGGFGSAPKFPHSMNIDALFKIHRRTGDKEALNMATRSLDGMANGGIYDAVGGGFHRYATQDDWNEPHYEKMLYDNALLVPVYLEAFKVTNNPTFAKVARETLDYVLRDMTDPLGGFYSAQDAGEVDKEGEYYHRTEKTIEEERTARQKRTPPHKDDKVLTSWNGLMIAAMAFGYKILEDKKYLQAAQKSAGFIQQTLYKNGELLRRYRDGDSRYAGTLEDYAFLIHGLLNLSDADANPEWKNWARDLQQKQDALFWDAKEGGYFFSPTTDKNLFVRKKTFQDGALPSGNAIAVLNLLRLGETKKAEALFKAMSGEIHRYPSAFGQSLIALDYAMVQACTDETCKINL
ncbi:MAG: thioredoxin domain-containing protein [Deltaproteobacteria bacterium]|nr:thioredoxin domain-containing protein [Deltaproteobacteria bacterium]